jgi:hypothetical protein
MTIWVLKLNSNGDIILQKTYGVTSGDFFDSISIRELVDCGYILIGSISEGGIVLKQIQMETWIAMELSEFLMLQSQILQSLLLIHQQ